MVIFCLSVINFYLLFAFLGPFFLCGIQKSFVFHIRIWFSSLSMSPFIQCAFCYCYVKGLFSSIKTYLLLIGWGSFKIEDLFKTTAFLKIFWNCFICGLRLSFFFFFFWECPLFLEIVLASQLLMLTPAFPCLAVFLRQHSLLFLSYLNGVLSRTHVFQGQAVLTGLFVSLMSHGFMPVLSCYCAQVLAWFSEH